MKSILLTMLGAVGLTCAIGAACAANAPANKGGITITINNTGHNPKAPVEAQFTVLSQNGHPLQPAAKRIVVINPGMSTVWFNVPTGEKLELTEFQLRNQYRAPYHWMTVPIKAKQNCVSDAGGPTIRITETQHQLLCQVAHTS